MEYALAYILLFLFFGFMALYHYSIEKPEIQSKINLLCTIVFFFFFGFRGFIGDDWQSYYVSFNSCDWEDLSLFPNPQWSYEPGFTLLILICKIVANDFQFFTLVTTLINTILLSRFLVKRLNNLPLGLMLYLCMGGLVMSTNLMRNSIAIFIFINALEYIEQRKPIPYFSLCLLACTFHFSSLFYLPLYFFLHRNINKWVYLGIFLLGNVILFLHIPLLIPLAEIVGGRLNDQFLVKINDYIEMQGAARFGISVGYLERLFTGLLVFIYMDKLKERRKENIIFINSLLLYFIMIFTFSEFEEFSKRMSNLFIYAYWILWYDIIKVFSVLNNRRLFISFVGIYCILKLTGTARYVSWQYDNILFGAKSFQERLYIYNRKVPESQ